MLHQFHIEFGLVQLQGQEQHGLDYLLPVGRVGVPEAMHNSGKDLGIDCCLIKVLDELLHLLQGADVDGPISG